jgi:hypothetical protein
MPKIYFEKLNKEICLNAKNPTPASRGVPKWWKESEKYNYEIDSGLNHKFPHKKYSTVRSCPAISDSFNFGYIVYTPIDVYIDATEGDSISWYIPEVNLSVVGEEEQSFIGFHHSQEFSKFNIEKNFSPHALKLNTFFGIKTEDGYSTWITHPIGREDLPFRVFDAIVDTDQYPSRFPYAFLIKNDFKGIIKAGTPLIQVIPFKREDFVSEIIDADYEEINTQISASFSRFSGAYRKLFWKRKKFI